MVGIYLLSFIGSDKVYIGQSSNIHYRYGQHVCDLAKGISTKRLQAEYYKYGLPKLTVLEETQLGDLDIREQFYISKYNSVEDGLNSCPNLVGDYANNIEKYKEAIRLMVEQPDMPLKDISSMLELPYSRISNLSTLSNIEKLPDPLLPEIEKLKKARDGRAKPRINISAKNYPMVLDPYGREHLVIKAASFCKEHNLDPGGFSRLLNGKRSSYKGWTVA